MNVLSMDLRRRIVAAYERKEGTYFELACRFRVGEASVSRLLRRRRERGHVIPEDPGGGFPPRIGDDQLPELVKLVAERPDATLDSIRDTWLERNGGELSRSSLIRALRRAGITRKKNASGLRNNSALTSPKNVKRSGKKSPKSR
jgi:transposase